MGWTVAIEALGIAVVLFTLREVFRDIFHPTRSGNFSDFVGRAASKLFRTTALRPAIGPGSPVAVIFLWASSLAVGFACIYFPLFPGQLGPATVSANVADRALHSRFGKLWRTSGQCAVSWAKMSRHRISDEMPVIKAEQAERKEHPADENQQKRQQAHP